MFNFSRRINGVTYYAGLVIICATAIGLDLIGELPISGVAGLSIGIILVIVALALLVYLICLVRQRANDIGWHPLILTALIFWTPLILALGFIPGKRTQNKFGPTPASGITLR